jgi:putative addiction module component (TIGR02574 family)
LELLEQLSDSLSATPNALPLTDAQREELDRHLNAFDRKGPAGIPPWSIGSAGALELPAN